MIDRIIPIFGNSPRDRSPRQDHVTWTTDTETDTKSLASCAESNNKSLFSLNEPFRSTQSTLYPIQHGPQCRAGDYAVPFVPAYVALSSTSFYQYSALCCFHTPAHSLPSTQPVPPASPLVWNDAHHVPIDLAKQIIMSLTVNMICLLPVSKAIKESFWHLLLSTI